MSKFRPGRDQRGSLVETLVIATSPHESERLWRSLFLLKPTLAHLRRLITAASSPVVAWQAWEQFRLQRKSDSEYRRYLVDLLCSCSIPELTQTIWNEAPELSEVELLRIAMMSKNPEVQVAASIKRTSNEPLPVQELVKVIVKTEDEELALDCWNQLVDQRALTDAILCEILGTPISEVATLARLVIEKSSLDSARQMLQTALPELRWDE